jgi:DNA-binding beta-propeller fold protein YncE
LPYSHRRLTTRSLLAALALCGSLAALRAEMAPQKSFAIVQRFKGPDGAWDYLSVDSSAHRLYVARSYGVLSVDLASGAVTDKLVDGAGVHGVLPLTGGRVVSSNGKSNNALIFDGGSGKVEATVTTGASPDAMVIEPKSGLVAIFNGKSRDVSLLDPRTREIAATIVLDGKPEAAASDGKGLIFVNLEDKAEIAVVDAATQKVKTRYALPGCESPTGLALDSQTGALVSACDNHVAKVLDAATGKDLATLPICAGPDGAMLDARRRRLFIPCADGQMSVLSLAAKEVKVAATVATGSRAKTGAVDEATGRVYLGAAQFSAPEKQGDKPKALPGTFEILVLSDEN